MARHMRVHGQSTIPTRPERPPGGEVIWRSTHAAGVSQAVDHANSILVRCYEAGEALGVCLGIAPAETTPEMLDAADALW